ncbi:MAG TPA: thioredoxin domain-containing protein [Bacteroidetes bacterium]|nr:thioredoxin domain-containing protein [Bacteroidota bacterium]
MPTNRLASEKSPYLLQHAHNPVEWWPWSDAAFEEARRRDVPVFLSVGYATCHWCHVMEEESFEDAEAAQALNRAFVCIKVDREERPDVDGVYMAACLALNGHGGWPLTALLTPDTREPFYVSTYLPKHSRSGRIGVIDLADRVRQLWAADRKNIVASAAKVRDVVEEVLVRTEAGQPVSEDDLARAVSLFASRFDPAHGGFGRQPKFPSPHSLLFLLRQSRRTGDPKPAEMAVRTLRGIARGGITDALAGGVHRYSTDARWLLPHFEKMLYDQAGLAMAWTEAWELTGDEEMRHAAERTLEYVVRDLQQPHGGIASAEDADSLDAAGRREEGAFYVWTESELAGVLGEDQLNAARVLFGTTAEGNYVDEATRQRTGANVLHFPDDLDRLAATIGVSAEDAERQRRSMAERLLEARASRPRPLLDDKILTDWNGLAIAALAYAGRALSRPDFTEAAVRAEAFLRAHLMDPDGHLLHRWREGEAAIAGMLDDYAFLVWGLMELAAATRDASYLQRAADLHDAMRQRFEADGGGFFLTDESADVLVRQRALDDGALPSGHAVAILNGLRLAAATGRGDLRESAERALASDARLLATPSGHAAHLLGAQLLLGPLPEIVITEGEGRQALAAALGEVYAPGALRLYRSEALAGLAPFTREMTGIDGRATAYVCIAGACQAPAHDPALAAETLATLYSDRTL